MNLFRTDLSQEERSTMKQWARDNYSPFTPIKGIWHPIVQAECTLINAQADLNVNDLSKETK